MSEKQDKTVEIVNAVPEGHYRKQREFEPSFIKIAAQLTAAGFTEKDLAYTFQVSQKTIDSWKHKYPMFKEACIEGKRTLKKHLVAKAFRQAMGFEYVEKNHKVQKDSQGRILKEEESQFEKEFLGNERLLVFLLCNLDRQLGDDEWKSVQKIEVEEKNVNVQIDGKAAKEQIKRLAGEILEAEAKEKDEQ